MPIIRLYSDQKRDLANAGVEDVYQYDVIPRKLRVQFRRIIRQTLGQDHQYIAGEFTYNVVASFVREALCQEMGKDDLGGNPKSPLPDLLYYLENSNTEGFLDAVAVICRVIDHHIIKHQASYSDQWEPTQEADDALDEINFRFRDAGVGYQIEEGELIRLDSQYAHAAIIKPALALLNRPGFAGSQAEFLTAHAHLRAGRNKEAITEAAKSFESLMKAVCDGKGWEYAEGARASDLLKVLRAHKLWPDYLDASFDQLVATLASGLPKVRDKTSAHGQGSTLKVAPQYLASYAINRAASKMLLIVEAAAD